MQIGQLSRKITALPSSSGGFTGNIVDNPKNETCKALETSFKVITNICEDDVMKEVLIEEDALGSKNEESETQIN